MKLVTLIFLALFCQQSLAYFWLIEVDPLNDDLKLNPEQGAIMSILMLSIVFLNAVGYLPMKLSMRKNSDDDDRKKIKYGGYRHYYNQPHIRRKEQEESGNIHYHPTNDQLVLESLHTMDPYQCYPRLLCEVEARKNQRGHSSTQEEIFATVLGWILRNPNHNKDIFWVGLDAGRTYRSVDYCRSIFPYCTYNNMIR